MKTKTHQDLCWHLPLLVAVFIQLWPIVFMVSTSLKDMDQILQATLNPLPLPPTLNNYLTVLGNFPLFTYIYNTFFIAAGRHYLKQRLPVMVWVCRASSDASGTHPYHQQTAAA